MLSLPFSYSSGSRPDCSCHYIAGDPCEPVNFLILHSLLPPPQTPLWEAMSAGQLSSKCPPWSLHPGHVVSALPQAHSGQSPRQRSSKVLRKGVKSTSS